MARRKPKDSLEPGVTILATNRKASFDFELGERYEAGLVLIGSEVKSLRSRAVGITEAWVSISKGEAFIQGMRVSVLDHAAFRSEERRVGKECRSRWSPYH